MPQFVREINDQIVIRLATDERGICLRGPDGTPVVAEEILVVHDGARTFGLNCHSTDRKVTVIPNEFDVISSDEWQ